MKSKFTFSIVCLIVCVCFACSNNSGKEKKIYVPEENMYASGFTIDVSEDTYRLLVNNPWQNADGVEYEYILSREEYNENSHSIHIPVKNIVCLSTTHLAYISELGKAESVIGMSGTKYVYNAYLQNRISNGEIKELGFSENLNTEQILSMNPDVVFAYVISPSELEPLQILEEAGIPVVLVGDYLEKHPLGKMEWLRFFAAFFDNMDTADKLVAEKETAYTHLCEMISTELYRPKTILNVPWQGIWWMPGGESFMAKFINDAGGKYLFDDLNGHEANPVDMEMVMQRIQHADIWLNPGMASSKQEVFAVDSRLDAFSKIESLTIYNNNKRAHLSGNDFFESAVVNPDLVLADLIRVFHPELLEGSEFVYFQELK